jgi:hypothetical protein
MHSTIIQQIQKNSDRIVRGFFDFRAPRYIDCNFSLISNTDQKFLDCGGRMLFYTYYRIGTIHYKK